MYILEPNQKMIPYINHLRDYPRYPSGEFAVICQRADDQPLLKLADQFGLRGIYVGANDLERIVALMEHVHRELLCTKEIVAPESMSFESIMAVKQKGSVYCSCYAACLSEALLTIGVPAVRVSCLPFEFDGDRHVGVLAYIKDSDRTAFFDPTFNTYFTNGSSALDLFDIRETYCFGRQPTFRPITIDKQWPLFLGGKEYADYDSWYGDYMAKNCFRFFVPETSKCAVAGDADRSCFFNPVGYDRENQYDTGISERTYVQASSIKPVQ